MRRYWLVHPEGGRQLIDPEQIDLEHLVHQVRRTGGRLIVEEDPEGPRTSVRPGTSSIGGYISHFEPPIRAVGPLFLQRMERIHRCRIDFELDINVRATSRVLGGYYRKRRLVRVYSHDRATGRRPFEELFDTFLHEMAHHLEYTEPDSFHARACGRVPGRMHSPVFWHILGEIKSRWMDLQRPAPSWID